MQRGSSYCSVHGCFNTSMTKPKISYFKHPADLDRRIQWLRLTGREDLLNKPAKNYSVCEEHFNVKDILPGRIRKTLKKTALPSLLLPAQRQNISEERVGIPIQSQIGGEPVIETSVKIEECNDPLSLNTDLSPEAPKKMKLASPLPGSSRKVPETQNSNNPNLVFLGQDTFQRLCTKFLTRELADLVKANVNLKHLAGKKHVDGKQTCLSLYHTSPQAYLLLQRALCLPCPYALHKSAISITSEVNSSLMMLLQSKVASMTDTEKNCSAVISTLTLKPHLFYNIKQDVIIGFQDINGVRLSDLAEKAYVMMVRGIFSDWRQPVGYALLPKVDNYVEFNEWIDGLLEKLFEIGLTVRTLVSDTGKEFINAANNRFVTTEKPYFFINDRKVYHVFDAPHLFKLLRNFFIEHDIIFQDRYAKYEHVRTFYDKEKKKEFKLAPKLTRNHIYPTNYEKMDPKYATQLFSNSLATGISTYVDFHVIDQSARDTADFIKLMNNLFDSLNSSVCKDNNAYQCAFSGKQLQIDFFNEMLIFFRNIKFCDNTYEVKFIECFQITITCILQLFDDIRLEGYTYLPTRRLNLEVVDHLFKQIRTKCGISSEPNSWQFMSGYRRCFLSNFIKPVVMKNCPQHLTKLLEQTNRFKRVVDDGKLYGKVPSSKQVSRFLDPDDEDDENTFKIMSSDYNQWKFPEKNGIFEVSHYLLTKCAEQHECKLFNSYIKPYKNIPNFIEENRYRSYREYCKVHNKSLLIVPCDNFIQFVKKMDAKFVPCFKMQQSCNKIAELLFTNIIEEFYSSPPCCCFPKTYLVKLFIRMNLYNVLKLNNKAFSASRSNIGRLVVNRI